MIIGIGGVSRAGKTTLSNFLKKKLRKKTYEIHLDHYIKESSHWDFFAKFPAFYLSMLYRKFDMEHPETIDFTRLYNDILLHSQENEIIIAEGFLITYDQRIRSLLDKYIHIHLTKEEFMKRRMNDFKRNNEWYANHVWNSFMKFGNNYHDLNHMVLNGNQQVDKEAVLRFLNSSESIKAEVIN
jgi:uridine kinase